MRLSPVLRAVLIGITALISVVFVVQDAQQPEIVYGDAIGYYMYLPSTLIYHNPVTFYDLSEQQVPEPSIRWQMNHFKETGLKTPEGYLINQYTYGIALMEAPFFITAHIVTKLSGGRANGFSWPYVLALRIANLFYALLGLWVVYRILKRWFSADISLITVLCIFLGSNLFWFALRQAGMSHIPLFLLYALLMEASIRLYEAPARRSFLWVGLLAGMITLIRPSDMLCLLIPLCYGLGVKHSTVERFRFFRQHYLSLLLAAVVFLLPFIPQLFYWKAASGQWLYYSYGQQSFNWTAPKILEGLFGGSNGWLAYSPLMVFSVFGLFCRKEISNWSWCLLLLLPLYIYVIYSWWCYNYINGLGSRPMIHLYPLLALPFAAFLQRIVQRGMAVRVASFTLVLILISVNYSFSMLQARGMLNSEDSNWMYNLGVLFRTRIAYRDLVTKDIGVPQPRDGALKFVKVVATEHYDDSLDQHYLRDTIPGRSGFYYHMVNEENAGKVIRIPYHKADFGDAHWLRCSGRFWYPANVDLYENHLMVADVVRQGYYPLWKGLRVENKIGLADSSCIHAGKSYRLDHAEPSRWGTIWCFVALPVRKLHEGDMIELSVWNVGHKEFSFDDLKLELYR